MTDPVTAVKTTAQQLHVARKELSTAEGRYDHAVAHLALTAEAKRLDAERELGICRRHLVSLLHRADMECGDVCRWANAKDVRVYLAETRPTAYGPVPNDGEANPTLASCRQAPGTAPNGLSTVVRRAGDVSEVTG